MRTGDEVREIFNLKYNNLNSGQSPGFNDFEISLLLTDAQRQIIDSYYTGAYAKKQPFESVERVRKNLSILTKEIELVEDINEEHEYFKRSVFQNLFAVNIPIRTKDYYFWRVLYESCQIRSEDICLNNKSIIVKPVRHDELDKILKNPFKGPKEFVLRVDLNGEHQLLSQYHIKGYVCRYIDFPKPFIISDLSEVGEWALIDGENSEIPCIFDNFMEDIIIDRAVELAIMGYRENSLQSQMIVNTRKE